MERGHVPRAPVRRAAARLSPVRAGPARLDHGPDLGAGARISRVVARARRAAASRPRPGRVRQSAAARAPAPHRGVRQGLVGEHRGASHPGLSRGVQRAFDPHRPGHRRDQEPRVLELAGQGRHHGAGRGVRRPGDVLELASGPERDDVFEPLQPAALGPEHFADRQRDAPLSRSVRQLVRQPVAAAVAKRHPDRPARRAADRARVHGDRRPRQGRGAGRDPERRQGHPRRFGRHLRHRLPARPGARAIAATASPGRCSR